MDKDEVNIKITTPLFEKAELDLLNNYNETMHDLITEYTKMYLEDKDKVITQRIIICQQEKIDQLTNNWNELEEWLESNWIKTHDIWYVKIINKMKEIKESSN